MFSTLCEHFPFKRTNHFFLVGKHLFDMLVVVVARLFAKFLSSRRCCRVVAGFECMLKKRCWIVAGRRAEQQIELGVGIVEFDEKVKLGRLPSLVQRGLRMRLELFERGRKEILPE